MQGDLRVTARRRRLGASRHGAPTADDLSWLGPPGGLRRAQAADYTPWTVLDNGSGADKHLTTLATADGLLAPPELAVDGYLECLQRCRERFPDLHIRSGVELGEPHWHAAAVAALLHAGQFDRVLGSLHCLPAGGQFSEMARLFRQRPAAGVVRAYLAEIPRLIEGSDAFYVLAHIDYPLRYWPAEAGPFDPGAFEEEFRHGSKSYDPWPRA